ncbi:murein transglycosylase A [Paraburkholderia phosphatilytica]|uniref:murein transglycosylase A n=1 Tax=Paraburkholderia phosphatilytica TaxID=2282883 RepID=UPI000E48DC62|nr:MltA domain-containing protein [Paraburkholderia phosphatilytica]
MRTFRPLFALLMTLAGCAANNPATTVTFGPAETANASRETVAPPPSPASPPPPPVLAPVDAVPQAQMPAVTSARSPSSADQTGKAAVKNPVANSTAGAPTGFATRHASYEAARYADLPGWSSDDLSASWGAFTRSCSVLGTRSGWAEPCAASRAVDPHDAAAIRQFFEANFNAYQIRNTDRTPDGTLTGYYEPLLNGSRQYGGAYIYPVYGTPDDMLYLDARRLPDRARGTTTAARIDGRSVIPLADVDVGNLKAVYALDLRDSVPDIRDKKIRLRLDHDRIVPYYSRAEIESGALKAPILAYVDDPVMLYSMQLQGAGKVRMRDGTILRFAYAEQNGRPFLPPIAHNNRSGTHRITVRGMEMQIDVTDDDTPAALATTPESPANHVAGGTQGGAPAAAADDDEPVSPLLRGFSLVTATTPAATTPSATAPPRHGFATSDPSYVFFRVIPDSPYGPVGALGVPLSAGRSVAVDPRTTPLGAPVFVSTRDDPQSPGAIDRLMMAQDSGGAIQGAVRADYFYGFGQTAQAQASHTKEQIRMWILLPKGLHIAAQEAGLKTRGMAPAAPSADCLVSDPAFCVDDAP